MKRTALAALVFLAAAAPAAAAPERITIISAFNPLLFGENAFVNGQLLSTVTGDDGQPALKGEPNADKSVTLEESPFPFITWTAVATVGADRRGFYSFQRLPSMATHFRTVSEGATSEKEVGVDVQPLIAWRVSPAGRSSVRFAGTLAPAHPGAQVELQRQSRSGAWTTTANVRLGDAVKGASPFHGRLRVRSPARLRLHFLADGDHLEAYSRTLLAAPQGARVRASAAACPSPRVTGLAFRPSPPREDRGATLVMRAATPVGGILSLDVRWGDGQRDHFTFAPSLREPSVTHRFRHRYATARSYGLRATARGESGACRRTSPVRRLGVRVAG
jgi:hypothetical protein